MKVGDIVAGRPGYWGMPKGTHLDRVVKVWRKYNTCWVQLARGNTAVEDVLPASKLKVIRRKQK